MASRVPQLPTELWYMILQLACTPTREPHRVGSLRIDVAPITVSQVCRGWRHFVIAHHEFWTDISYVFSRFLSVERPIPQVMHVFLERSAGLPLTLNLDIEEDSLESKPAARKFLGALLANLKRWQSAKLFISLKNIDFFERWEDFAIDEASLLESLEMSIQPIEGEASLEIWPTFLWDAAPKLTKLAIRLDYFNPTNEYRERLTDEDRQRFEDGDPDLPRIWAWALTSCIPYHQLTHLLLDAGPSGDLTWREVASIIQRARDLVSGSFRGINGHHDLPRLPPQPVLLQHLQHLDLSGTHGYVDEGTFIPSMNQTLTAPSLQSLSLLRPSDTWDAAAYEEFIERSGCPLTHLHFGLSQFQRGADSNLLDCIRLSPPTLRSLHTTHLGVLTPEFTEQMGEWDEVTGKFKLCPLLEQIAINIFIPSSFPDPFKGMPGMLKKRLCPPDGSPGSFKKLIVSPRLRNELVEINDLVEDPYGLRIEYGTVFAEAVALFDIYRRDGWPWYYYSVG